MKPIIKSICSTLAMTAICMSSGLNSLYAAPLSISNTPLFLDRDSIPNVFFEVDDSGSMDWEILTRQYWHYCAYNSNGYGNTGSGDCGWLVTNGLWRSYSGSSFQDFEYIFDDADHAYSRGCNSDRQTLEKCESETGENLTADADWRVKSSSVNVMYYDPKVSYEAWEREGMSDASFTAARSDPKSGSDGYTELRDLTGFSYEVWEDDRGHTGERPRRGTNINATSEANSRVDLWDKHTRYTFQENGTTGDDEVLVEVTTYAPNSTGLHPTTVSSTLTGTGSHTELGGGAVASRTIAEAQQNVANWYQYSRKRAYVAKGALAAVVSDKPGFRYGLSVINAYSTLFKEVPESTVTNFATHNQEMLDALFNLDWPTSSTPLRKGLERTGKYYDDALSGKDDPIISECQQNFSVLFTDGYWNGSNPGTVTGDEDGDGYSVTVADVAKYYYDKDLSGLPNNVPTSPQDSNSKQHMVTFTVAFGVEGRLEDTDGNGKPDTRNGVALASELDSPDDDWGDATPSSDIPEKVDDLWHAAFNSTGTFVSAKTPSQVVKGLTDALANIDTRVGSAASVAASSTSVHATTSIYQARFDSDDWSGQIVNYPISDGTSTDANPNRSCTTESLGDICPAYWDAGSVSNGINFGARKILTYNPSANTGSGKGIPFRWPDDIDDLDANNDLSTAQVAAILEDAPEIPSNQDYGQWIVDYVRGDDSNEGTSAGKFRNRSRKLGDIINSSPFYVAAPLFAYPDTLESAAYSTFATDNASRTPVVYVGANDGMMHAYNALTGSELLAYVPSVLYSKLPDLVAQNYNHQFYVDGSPTAGDVFYDDIWHTVLVGGLSAGGQAVYALDVTDPGNFSEGNASSLVLWEFTDADDADMGYSYSQPDIVKMNDGTWAAIFGNGYNNTQADGTPSTTGHAVLYIVNIETGALIKKISTEAGDTTTPNGLSTVTPVDIDQDLDVDYIYAGDLLGNMWKFDVTGSNTSQWDVAFSSGNGNNAAPAPLFSAIASDGTAQPITTRPTVSDHPVKSKDGLMVYFGTGKYLETMDTAVLSVPTQTFYGIWDNSETVDSGRTSGNYDRLLKQEIIKEPEVSFDFDGDGSNDTTFTFRISTDNDIDWNGEGEADPHLGWYLDLINTEDGNTANRGEKQVTNPVYRSGRIIFTTLLPSSNPCSAGGSSFLMELDASNGGPLSDPPFDIDNDGDFDDNDMYQYTLEEVTQYLVQSGIQLGEGILTAPKVLNCQGKECKYLSNSAGGIDKVNENQPEVGRQSWRQLFR